MRSGRLNTRITIQSPGDDGESETGYPSGTPWQTLTTVWAEKSQTTGRERWANEHVAVSSPVNFRIRYREDIGSEMRVLHRSHTYNITAPPVDPDGKRESLILQCEEVT